METTPHSPNALSRTSTDSSSSAARTPTSPLAETASKRKVLTLSSSLLSIFRWRHEDPQEGTSRRGQHQHRRRQQLELRHCRRIEGVQYFSHSLIYYCPHLLMQTFHPLPSFHIKSTGKIRKQALSLIHSLQKQNSKKSNQCTQYLNKLFFIKKIYRIWWNIHSIKEIRSVFWVIY